MNELINRWSCSAAYFYAIVKYKSLRNHFIGNFTCRHKRQILRGLRRYYLAY